MRIPALRTLIISAAALFVFAGCGSVEVSGNVNTGDEFEDKKLERVLSDGLAEKTEAEWTTSCPKDVKMKKGDAFECTAKDDEGYRVHVAVTQTDSKGNIDYELVDDIETGEAAEGGEAAAPEA